MTSPIERGNRARQIIEDPLFIEAWEGLERGAIDAIASCDASDTKRLQSLTMAMQTVRAVRRRFEMWMAHGQDEAEKLIRKENQPAQAFLSRFRRQA